MPTAIRTNGASYAPWSGSYASIEMTGATTQVIGIEDDDSSFEHPYYSPAENQQTLTHDVTLTHGTAQTVLPAGTGIIATSGGFITGPDGERFVTMFPVRDNDAFGQEVGQRYSVILIPVPAADGSLPVFELGNSYRFSGNRTIGTSNPSTLIYGLATPLCFAEGTLIATDAGPCPVQDLRPGDRLWTLDAGYQRLKWRGMQILGPSDLDLAPQRRPIRVAAGALGCGQPARDLVLSPQHRVLIRSAVAKRMGGSAEMLVAIRHLVGMPGIEVMRRARSVIYWHLLLRDHHILDAEGALAESLLPGPEAMRSLAPAARAQIMSLIAGRQIEPARPILRGQQARGLQRRHAKNAKPLVAPDQSPTRARANSSASKASRSSICSPTPMA
ncbi:Hint domain-containing protein [Paracoccus sp. 1_MG-2023]|nr:Hint domain-containing protein [Paracoccus sp. 1_MG-2023]MDO6668507.1 Hint domain-containing protein [Paracoccus sp. 1_MG-2023]